MDKKLERILPRVQKPARYVGGEYNAVIKDKGTVDTRIAFCFPDTYEIGMSNLGNKPYFYGALEKNFICYWLFPEIFHCRSRIVHAFPHRSCRARQTLPL